MSRLQTNAIRHLGSAVDNLTLDNAGRVLMASQPVFYAVNNDSVYIASNTVVKHNNVLINRGGNYDKNTGRFTAPVAGAYEFNWGHISSSTNDVYRMIFEKNGSQSFNGTTGIQVRVDTGATGTEYGVGYRNVILELAAGDYVQLRAVSDAGNAFYSDTLSGYVSFSGRLIG